MTDELHDNSRFNAGTDPAANTGTDDSHCCQQYADLTGLSVEVVKRVGSCGCVQAKRELAELRAERRADRAYVMRLRAELERVRPVVEAACEWRTALPRVRRARGRARMVAGVGVGASASAAWAS